MDHYSTLGVSKTATPDEIKKAYRKLASQHHPDKGGDTATFQKLQTAYDTLSDPQKKEQYDNPSPFGNQRGGGWQEANGMPPGFNFGGAGFEEIFGQIFKQHAQRPQQARQPPSYRTSVWVSLEQVYTGTEQAMKLQTPNGTHSVSIAVPKGMTDGGQMRYDGLIEGASLIVEFRIHPHLKFNRRGNDLECNHQISVLDLIAGTSFEFVTLSGKTLEVTIQPKTQPYMHLKLAGQGMPILNTSAYGDQIILLKPFIPDTIDERITNSILQSRTN
jgi:DnaJ-class molecular chaperone